jgi:hypothetical protein
MRSFAWPVALTIALFASACATSNPIEDPGAGGEAGTGAATSTGSGTGVDPASACLLHTCNNDAECAGCPSNRTSCLLTEHRCVACGEGLGCPAGMSCTAFGDCVPDGASCPTDGTGEPIVACTTSADCIACDPLHQVCDPMASQCVACTDFDTSACDATDRCVNNRCTPKCPVGCASDNDCSQCGAPGHYAHACNGGQCAECSETYACPAGMICSPQGTCVAKCGQDGAGSCYDDADCAQCADGATQCHKPINGPGQCGPAAAGCSDLGQGTVVLPSPWNEVTNLCSHDADCTGVGVQLDVGKLLRDLTGIEQIDDADITYGMNVCAAVSVGEGANSVSCGVCVPCRVDADCGDIDVDQVAGQAFGPIGSVAAAILLDQVFGQNDHKVHMYCETIAGGYGVCAPCPGVVYACGVDQGGSSGSSCAHDTCATGAALDASCGSCAASVCAADDYCCSTAWDDQCVSEVATYCGASC